MKLQFILLILVLQVTRTSWAQDHRNPGENENPEKPLPVIAFISEKDYIQADAETRAAFDLLKSMQQFHCEYLTFKELKKQFSDPGKIDLIWFHKPDTSEFPSVLSEKAMIRKLQQFIGSGGKMFLSLDAMKYLVTLGLEPVTPDDSVKSSVDEGYGRKLGYHAFRDHPVFRGMYGGAYVWRPTDDLRTRITGYFGEKVPKNGRVIAVDWDYIFLREGSKLVLEYKFGKGTVIAAGAYLLYSKTNYNREHLELFTRNIFEYLLYGNLNYPEYYWDYSPVSVSSCKTETHTVESDVSFSWGRRWDIAVDTLMDFIQPATVHSWDLAGERMLVMGVERSGIEEVWAHPFMAFRDFEAALRFKDDETLIQLKDLTPLIRVNPGYFSRTYQTGGIVLREVTVTDPEQPTGVIHYELEGSREAELIFRFKSNLRLMWPYSGNVLNSICYTWNNDYQAFVIKDTSQEFVTMIGANRKPDEYTAGWYSEITFDSATGSFGRSETKALQVAALVKYSLKGRDAIDVVFAATDEGEEVTKGNYLLAMKDPGRIFENMQTHCRILLDSSLLIISPDRNFNRGYRWSLISTDRFFVNTPGMGKALVAGYSTTRRGWDGGHRVNGRPGYGWYFGRDGQWSGMAMLDYGDFNKVKKELEFFNRYQDLSGKIFHEATTSGVIHYDAADATPLYIVLAGRYFRHSNDTAFIRKSWPAIKKAIDYCYSTDTDRDHLIENTNVGHGWVEGGELYGSHATLYLNSCWSAALTEAAGMAGFLGVPESDGYFSESAAVRRILNSEFWNRKDTFYCYGKNIDGSFRKDPTILPAVTLDFKLADKDKAAFVLRQYASNAFTTNWGARIVRDDSPFFNPKGYHYGSVWPLFTGWAALAEYSYGNSQQGFSHIMNNLNIYKNWELGTVEEVMNGAEYTPSGVCPHQCWSETMILQPAIEGMLGLEVRAIENKVVLAPRFPADWNDVTVKNIRCGNFLFDLIFHRNDGMIRWQFIPHGAGNLNIEFSPALPAGTIISEALMNGKRFAMALYQKPQMTVMITKFTLNDTLDIDFLTSKGISVLPIVAVPVPGDKAAGLRLISAELKKDSYVMELESLPASSGIIRLYNRNEILKVENGTILSCQGNILEIKVDFELATTRYCDKRVTVYFKGNQ